jgi:hypothetical protein
MIFWKSDQNEYYPLAKGLRGLQFGDEEPEIFDFETEEKWRMNKGKNTLPIKTANKPGKILEFKRKKQESY